MGKPDITSTGYSAEQAEAAESLFKKERDEAEKREYLSLEIFHSKYDQNLCVIWSTEQMIKLLRNLLLKSPSYSEATSHQEVASLISPGNCLEFEIPFSDGVVRKIRLEIYITQSSGVKGVEFSIAVPDQWIETKSEYGNPRFSLPAEILSQLKEIVEDAAKELPTNMQDDENKTD
ncbi:MAG: hypothetical protein WC817_03870 [Patescibacteria group bacterium]|jgi:hypothetical protein